MIEVALWETSTDAFRERLLRLLRAPKRRPWLLVLLAVLWVYAESKA
jgi:hypothetical protein